jgi:pimeloyl-ACP methyl ester carboxylesterase
MSPLISDCAAFDFAFHGHRIFGREGGKGPRLWLIHGFPTSSHDWLPLWPALADHFRLQAIDMLGFGESAKPRDFTYSIAASAEQWEALAARDGIEEVELLAHDYGNTVAQELLARQREGRLRFRIRRATFLNGGLFPEATHPLKIQRLLAGPLGPLLVRLLSRRSFEASMRRICARPWPEGELDAAWRRLQHAGGTRAMPNLLRYIAERSAHRDRWVGALLEAGCPLALINGVEDPISGASIVRRWRELLPEAPVIELDGVGHYPQLEAPAQVLAALDEIWPAAVRWA